MDEERQSFLKWLFGGATKPAGEITPAAFGVVGQPALASTAESDEVKRLRDELAKAKAERITSDATHFVDEQIAAHKALPAEREAIIAAFTQAAQDDGQHGAVTFDDGTASTSRIEQLKAMFAARPAHTLTQELVKTQEGDAAAFAADNKTQQQRDLAAAQPMSKERRAELLGLTDIGRDVLRNGQH